MGGGRAFPRFVGGLGLWRSLCWVMGSWSVVDLFAGAGGLSAGFRSAGFVSVCAVEWDAAAAATYATNFGGHVLREDITVLGDAAFPAADVVVGGPPCQGFSTLGARDPNDPRNRLWSEFVRVVEVVSPQVFVLENVPRFVGSDQFGLLCAEAERLGYGLVWGVLDAADFGVPQRRKRVFVVGARSGVPSLPSLSHSSGGIPQRWVTVRDAFVGVPFETVGSVLPDRGSVGGVPGPFRVSELHLGRNPTELSLARYRCVPPGGGRFDIPYELLPPCWRRKKSGTTDVMGRLRWDEPSVTVRTEFFKPEKGRYLHPQWVEGDPGSQVNRPLTHWEAARLQSFSDDFLWCGSKVDVAKQIGNAVPPRLAEAVASHLVEAGLVV